MMQTVKIKRFFFRCAVWTVLFTVTACTADETIRNAGFESGEIAPWKSHGCSVSVVSSRPHSGRYHLQLKSDGSPETWATASQQQPAAAGQKWQASIYALCKNGVYVLLKLEFRDADGKLLAEFTSTGTESEYMPLLTEGTAPEGTALVRLVAAVEFGVAYDPVLGYFDDASLQKISAD